MLAVISPAKSLDWSKRGVPMTAPVFQGDAVRLAKTARNLTLRELKALMSLSDDLARLNRDRFAHFAAEPAEDVLRPAIHAFAGDTYQGFEAGSVSDDAMAYAQDHLRILSGLYGLLRPLDGIQPYRLEMGCRLKTRRGARLYDYWGDQIAKALRSQAEAVGACALVNCASQEYFGAVPPAALGLDVITPSFLEERNGTAKTVSFFAKRARGAMARFVVERQVKRACDLEAFDWGGYRFDAARSRDRAPVFARPYPERAAA